MFLIFTARVTNCSTPKKVILLLRRRKVGLLDISFKWTFFYVFSILFTLKKWRFGINQETYEQSLLIFEMLISISSYSCFASLHLYKIYKNQFMATKQGKLAYVDNKASCYRTAEHCHRSMSAPVSLQLFERHFQSTFYVKSFFMWTSGVSAMVTSCTNSLIKAHISTYVPNLIPTSNISFKKKSWKYKMSQSILSYSL